MKRPGVTVSLGGTTGHPERQENNRTHIFRHGAASRRRPSQRGAPTSREAVGVRVERCSRVLAPDGRAWTQRLPRHCQVISLGSFQPSALDRARAVPIPRSQHWPIARAFSIRLSVSPIARPYPEPTAMTCRVQHPKQVSVNHFTRDNHDGNRSLTPVSGIGH